MRKSTNKRCCLRNGSLHRDEILHEVAIFELLRNFLLEFFRIRIDLAFEFFYLICYRRADNQLIGGLLILLLLCLPRTQSPVHRPSELSRPVSEYCEQP